MKKKILLSLAIGGFCLWLALRGVKWFEVGTAFRGLRWLPLTGLPFLLVITHFFRARRWRLFLKPIRLLTVKELFAINALGFLAIHVFPFRIGEFARPLLLKRRQGISFSSGLATVAIERVFDGLVMTLVLVIGILGMPVGSSTTLFVGVGLESMALLALALFLAVFAFLFLAVVRQARALKLVEKLVSLFPVRFRSRSLEVARNFIAGLRCLPSWKGLTAIFLESLGVWSVMVVAYWLVLRAFQIDVPWNAPFAILGIAMAGIMLPSPPGFVGTYQLFVVAALSLFGVSKSMGFAYSVVIHAANLGYSILVGLIFLPWLATPVKDLVSEVMESSRSETG